MVINQIHRYKHTHTHSWRVDQSHFVIESGNLNESAGNGNGNGIGKAIIAVVCLGTNRIDVAITQPHLPRLAKLVSLAGFQFSLWLPNSPQRVSSKV